ncbi:hypothetical protein QAD02_001951 [Eretmocerus hayati]|uniref:Uncharacterized protein n=1 Tax=Eretmocerus hayati TaxID=131215 RepID=A0ACC2NKD0_9HYME|nr:hypothetical protein QAD02_001951 [Eretmocerus hayati]
MEALQKYPNPSEMQYKELSIGEKKYIVGVRKMATSRQVVLTDLTTFYEETLSAHEIVKRCENLNPILVDFDWEDIVDNLLDDIPKFALSCDTSKIDLKTKIDDGNFYFKIELTETSPHHFYREIVNSFCTSFSELHNRYRCLLRIVKSKDEEIAEYKAQGIEPLRRSLITEPFNETKFINSLKTKSFNHLKIFMDSMNLYHSLNLPQIGVQSKEESIANSSTSQQEDPPLLSKSTHKKDVKRPASSRIRCAVPPKFKKKSTIPKKKSDLDFL